MNMIKALFVGGLLTLTSSVFAQSFKMSFSDVNIEPGKTANLKVTFQSDVTPVAWQMHIYLPTGIEIAIDEDREDFLIELSDSHNKRQHVDVNMMSDNDYVLIMYSSAGKYEMTATEGDLCTITLKAADTFQSSAEAIVNNIAIVDKNDVEYNMESDVSFIIKAGGALAPTVPEPYAVLRNNNTVLTFYYDENKEERNGMDVGPFTLTYDQERNREVINSGWDEQRDNITKVVFDDSFADCTSITSTAYWFYEFRNSLTTITGIRNLNTANVTDMSDMFYYCAKLESLDVSGFNTANVTSMRGLFMGCNNLTSLDVSNFKTDNVTSMDAMFFACRSLTSLDVTNFNTANVTSMHQMFVYCSSLTSLDVSNFNTANVYAMSRMFEQCESLTSLDLSSFNTSKVIYNPTSGNYGLKSMFSGCSKLTTIFVGEGWTTANLTESSDVFKGCTRLVGGAGTHFDTNHTDYTYAHIDGGTANPGYFTAKMDPEARKAELMSRLEVIKQQLADLTSIISLLKDNTGNAAYIVTMLQDTEAEVASVEELINKASSDDELDECEARVSELEHRVQELYRAVENYKPPVTQAEPYAVLSDNNTVLTFYYDDQKAVRGGVDINNSWLNGNSNSPYGSPTTAVIDASFADYRPTSTAYWFTNCSLLTSITGMENLKTDNVTDMGAMFWGCSSLTSINLSSFNTANVTNYVNMFDVCSSLASIQAGNANIPTEEYASINNPNLLVYVNEASLAPQGIQNVVINGQAKEIILTDATSGNNNFFCPQPFRAEKISYTREFKQQTEVGVSRGWEGIALPFNVQTITHETKGTITPFGSGNGKHFWLRAYDGEKMYSAREMEAYAPYVIAMPNSDSYFADYNLNGRVTFSATNTEVYETPDFSFMENEPNMPLMTIPAFQCKAQSDSIYAINVGQARGNYAEGSVFEAGLREVRPFEVYTVHHGQGARPRYIPIPAQGNDATGIKDIENVSDARDNWYDLNGRKLSGEPKAKGVYLQNGKKVVIK